MNRPFYKHPLFYVPTGIGIVLLVLFLLGVFSAGEYILTGHTPAILRFAKWLRHTDPSREVEIIVGLGVRNEKELDELLDHQADPSSPEFRKFLSKDEFIKRFSPSEQDVQKVKDYLKKEQLTVVDVSENRLLVRVRGSAKNIGNAFKVTLNDYQLGNKTGTMADRDPRIPNELKDIVLCVIGMNDFARFRSLSRSLDPKGPGSETPSGFSPLHIAAAYGHPNSNNKAHTGSKYSGKGITIAIATAFTYDQQDVDSFWRQSGITRTGKITNVAVHGSTNTLNGETTLDLQQIGAQAPAADILMYQGKDPSFVTFTMVFNQVVCDNRASICSVSWGMCEKNTGQAEMKAEHVLFKQGAAQGIAFFVAAGDDGAYDCAREGATLGVDYPSSDPNVTAVGGTALRLNADGSRKEESAWTGAGGGVSHYYDRPAWQKGAGLPDNQSRNTSDVALNSDPQTGFSLLFQGKWHVSGGTSFAAPNWAAIWALGEEAAGGRRLGPCTPVVYRIGRSDAYKTVFYDITVGNNGDGRGPGYNCTDNWDHPTGWGTPNVVALLEWLKKDLPTAPQK